MLTAWLIAVNTIAGFYITPEFVTSGIIQIVLERTVCNAIPIDIR